MEGVNTWCAFEPLEHPDVPNDHWGVRLREPTRVGGIQEKEDEAGAVHA